MRRCSSLVALLLLSLLFVGCYAKTKFHMKGKDTKVAMVKKQELRLNITAGNDYPNSPAKKWFNLTIGGCEMVIDASMQDSGRIKYVAFNVLGPGASIPTSVNDPKNLTAAPSVEFGSNTIVGIPGCVVKFEQKGDQYTIPVELVGDVPSDLEFSSNSAWLHDEGGEGTAKPTEGKPGFATWKILVIVGAIIIVIILLLIGGGLFWFLRRKRQLKKQQMEDNVRTAPGAVEEGLSAMHAEKSQMKTAKYAQDDGVSKVSKKEDDEVSKVTKKEEDDEDSPKKVEKKKKKKKDRTTSKEVDSPPKEDTDPAVQPRN